LADFSVEVLHYFGLDCGMWEFFKYFYSRAVIQRTIVNSPTFLETSFGRKHCGLYPYNPSADEVGGLEVFLHEVAQNFELFSDIQDQN
jgi:hypothetical protein